MTDAVASYVINKIGDYLAQQASLFLGVEGEVKKLRDDLTLLQAFVKDAEDKQLYEGSQSQRELVSQIRDIAYDIEDILDEYILKVEKRKKQNQGLLTYSKKCFCLCEEERDQYNIANEIQPLKERLSAIFAKSSIHQFINPTGKDTEEGMSKKLDKQRRVGRTNSMDTQEWIVGVEDDANILRGKLLDGNLHRMVISIYGTGGLGKTTLATKLYKCDEVCGKFDLRAWIYVSQVYQTKHLLQNVIKSFWTLNDHESEKVNKMTEEDLERYLYGNLSGKCYLLVVDDVWEREVWEILSKAFPEDKKGSRVIMTTRNKNIAECVKERCFMHNLCHLSFKESWELFCKRACESSDPMEVEQRWMIVEQQMIAKEMVERCGGLPLAIIVLGGLLSQKEMKEWEKVSKRLWKHLEKGSPNIANLLDLSFQDLPHHLKLCFLYLSIFPEDYEIEKGRLILLFIAEGFILRDGRETMEEVAEDYLVELADRGLILAKKHKNGNLSATLRIHDLLRDLAIKKAKELGFVHAYGETSNLNPSSCRRQGIHHQIDEGFLSQNLHPKTRSLIAFGEIVGHVLEFDGKDLNRVMQERLKLLRVLDLRWYELCISTGQSYTEVQAFNQLIHLRYLALIIGGSGRLGTSFNNLCNLEIFLLHDSRGFKDAIDLRNLRLLRHLVVNGAEVLLSPDMKYLQTLKGISFSTWEKMQPRKLIHLRELYLEDSSKTDVSFECFAELKNLQALRVWAKSFISSSLEQLRQCRKLIILRLYGVLKKFPEDAPTVFPNLECLVLEFTGLEEDPMPLLGKLPQLRELQLWNAFHFAKMLSCKADGFPRLETLRIFSPLSLVEVHVEADSMLMLRVLATDLSKEKLKIPERLLPSLSRLWTLEYLDAYYPVMY